MEFLINAKLLLLIVFYLATPALIIFLSQKLMWMQKIGPIVIIYIIGLIIGNIGILNGDVPDYNEKVYKLQENISAISILIALPLLLMVLDFKNWAKMARKSLLSLILGVVSVFIVVVAGYFIFKNSIHDTWKISGLLVGVYTGGTPNLASIKEALDVQAEQYIMVHTSDIIFSGLYLLFLMSIGKMVFKRLLPYKYLGVDKNVLKGKEINQVDDYSGFFKKENIKSTLFLFFISVLILVFGFSFSFIVPEKLKTMVVIIVITSSGILLSFVKKINSSPKSYEFGMYLILVFSLVVATMADINKFDISYLPIFNFIAFTITLSLLLHLLLSRMFRIDSDTMIITSTALICSPPFVPVIAGALNNRSIIISGLTIGIIGFAIGNYLGIFTALLLGS